MKKQTTDTVPAMLTPGEYVLPEKTVDRLGGAAVLDKMVSATNGKKPGGKPLGLRHGYAAGGIVPPMADAQADYQRWLDAGGVTAENVDPSVYGFANGGAVRRMKNIDPNAVQPALDVGQYWSDSNAEFEAGNPGALDRVGRAINPITGLGSALGAVHDAAGHGDVAGMALGAAGAVPAFGVARLAAIPGRGLVKSTQAMLPSAKHTGAAVAGNAAFGAAADAYVPGQENGTAQPVAQRQNVALPNTTAKDQRRYAREVMGYDAGGAVKEEKKPAAVDVMTGAAPVPASGSYAEQRNYARQTGALNVPAEKPPAPVPALPASSTLTRGSADWSRSVAAEQAAKQKPAFDKLVEQRSRPGLMPGARTPNAPAPDAQEIRSARSDYTSEKDKAVALLAGQGYSMRDVPNAKGVQRLTGKDGRTIYTNDLADTADWVSGGMKPGVNTVAASNFTNPAAAVSRIIGPALQAAADRGDFGAIRSHYQRGGGTFRGETANQTALRRRTEPSGSVMIGSDDKQAADQLAAKIGSMTNDAQGMIRRGDVKGAAVMDRLIGNHRDILGQMNDRTLSRREGVERGREAAIDRLMRTEELSARSRDEAAARERDRRLLALEDRVINARTPEELARAAETLRMLTGRQDRQSVQMSYTSTKDPVSGEEVRTPVAYDPNSGTWQRMPGGGATGQFIEGKVYVDANGNRATYKNGAWVPA